MTEAVNKKLIIAAKINDLQNTILLQLQPTDKRDVLEILCRKKFV